MDADGIPFDDMRDFIITANLVRMNPMCKARQKQKEHWKSFTNPDVPKIRNGLRKKAHYAEVNAKRIIQIDPTAHPR